ncbi:MAG: hypothetical protein ACYC3O_04460 [Burkholderiales bacterium]
MNKAWNFKAQLLDVSDFMFDPNSNEIETLVSQSVTPSKNRNAAQFFEQFWVRLTQTKIEQRVTDCDPFDNLKHSTWFAFSKMEMRANEMLTRVKV